MKDNKNPVSEGSHWSYPAGKGTGMVWFGTAQATEADIEALKEECGPNVGIDELSLCGRYDAWWNSAWYKDKEPKQRPGGLGSTPYETQHCGSGVSFEREEPMWHFNADGKMVKAIPDGYAYHEVYDGDGFVLYAGPEPNSEAAKMLGDSRYLWDEKHGWYYIEGTSPKPVNGERDSGRSCPHCGKTI